MKKAFGELKSGETERLASGFYSIPSWVAEIEPVRLTADQLKDLPEYSTTLPDSYKRPISEGGRPWKRNVNVYGRFQDASKPIWIYCEYVPDEDPKFLGILNKRIEIL